jgi:hypothetical protein
VAFFQLVDICARSGQLEICYAEWVFDLAAAGCARIGTKGLAELLSSAAATAALGSALCSLLKLAVQHTKEQAAQTAAAAAAAAAAGDARGDLEQELSISRILYSPIELFSKVLLPLGLVVLPAVEAAPSSSSQQQQQQQRWQQLR